jgi:predicted acyl esterase
VHVIADARGTGDSEGEHIGVFDRSEAEDGYDLIEWIAEQPWCDGNVGMVGISYFGITQLFIASEQPPHLKAIFPFEVYYDVYRHVATDGGVIAPNRYRMYTGRGMDGVPSNGSGYAPRNVVSATMKNLSEEEFKQLHQERLQDTDIQMHSIYWSVLRYPRRNPLFADFLLNPNDGPFYWERTPYTRLDKINVPAFIGGPWFQIWSAGAFYVYEAVNAPKKCIMVPPGSVDRPWNQLHEELIRWYDHWLKGIDTGIMDEPPIKIFVMGANKWRYENEWPLARTKWTNLYLHAWEGLSFEAPAYEESPESFVQPPLNQTSRAQTVCYRTAPLSEDVEVTGPLVFNLYASIDQEDTNWYVRFRDVDEHGNAKELTYSWLKASHRALDESRSKPWFPWHFHTQNEPVVPGEINEYIIGLAPISNVFKAGHRIEIEIASVDTVGDGLHICSSKTVVHTVYHDTVHASHLVLPVIPRE